MTNQIKTREGKEYWDKICSIPSYGFIHSPDNTQVLKVEGIGNWIDKHAAQEVVDQAQDKINELTSENKRLQVALGEIAWCNNSKWQSDRADAALNGT